MEGRVETPSPLVSRELRGGTLPDWAPYGVVAGSLAFAAAVLLATGSFSVALLLVGATVVSCIAIYAWSRVVEGPRRALDRLMTFAIIAPFLGLAGLFTVTANNNGPVGTAINALVAAEALWIVAASLTLPLRKPQAVHVPARP